MQVRKTALLPELFQKKEAFFPDFRLFYSCNQLLQLCTTRTAWSEWDQAVRAVHSCNKW